MKEANVEELARRAVACRRWKWMPGMRTLGGTVHTRPVVVLVLDSEPMPVEWAAPPSDAHRHEIVSAYGNPGWRDVNWERALPDLTDPATLGCLLALVREAWSAPRAMVRMRSYPKPADYNVFDVDRIAPNGGNWAAWLSENAPTEAAALVVALEAAP